MGSRMESWPLARGSRWQEELVGVWSEGQEMPVETHKPRMEEDDKEIIPHIRREPGRAFLLHGLRRTGRKLVVWERKQEGAKKRSQPSRKPGKLPTPGSAGECAVGAE